jgi:hypothetical protein
MIKRMIKGIRQKIGRQRERPRVPGPRCLAPGVGADRPRCVSAMSGKLSWSIEMSRARLHQATVWMGDAGNDPSGEGATGGLRTGAA